MPLTNALTNENYLKLFSLKVHKLIQWRHLVSIFHTLLTQYSYVQLYTYSIYIYKYIYVEYE